MVPPTGAPQPLCASENGVPGARIKMGKPPWFPTLLSGPANRDSHDGDISPYPKRSFLLVTQVDPEMFVGVTHLSPPVDLNQFVGCTLDQNLGTVPCGSHSTSLQFWMFIPFI